MSLFDGLAFGAEQPANWPTGLAAPADTGQTKARQATYSANGHAFEEGNSDARRQKESGDL